MGVIILIATIIICIVITKCIKDPYRTTREERKEKYKDYLIKSEIFKHQDVYHGESYDKDDDDENSFNYSNPSIGSNFYDEDYNYEKDSYYSDDDGYDGFNF